MKKTAKKAAPYEAVDRTVELRWASTSLGAFTIALALARAIARTSGLTVTLRAEPLAPITISPAGDFTTRPA